MHERISGGIVTYNNEDTIKECIESVLVNTEDCNFCLYVYDNGSTDSTIQIIKSNFPQVVLIEGDQNIGFGGGHNQIVRRVRSIYHVIINPDILFKNDVIGPMTQYMDANTDVVQLTTEIHNMDGTIQYLPKEDPNFKYVILSKFKPFRKYRSLYTREFDDFNKPTEILSSTGCFSMVRTDAFKKIHGYDRRFFLYFEDADLSRRLRSIGKIIYMPELWVCHAWKRENTRSLRGMFIFLRSMLKYYIKWRSL